MHTEGTVVDPWRVLGVHHAMPIGEIRIAYRRLAMETHPDRHPNDPDAKDRLRIVVEAWRRIEEGAVPVPPPSPFAAAFEDIVRASEDFEAALAPGAPTRGADVEAEVFLSFAESLADCRRTLPVRSIGSRSRTTTVEIPGGVVGGEMVVFSGLGGPGTAGGPRGDLKVRVSVGAGDGFSIDGLDVMRTVRVPVWDAALGCDVALPLPRGGRRWMKLPAGSPSMVECRFPGEGISADGRRGDYVVRVEVDVPDAVADPGLGKLFAAMRPGRLAAA